MCHFTPAVLERVGEHEEVATIKSNVMSFQLHVAMHTRAHTDEMKAQLDTQAGKEVSDLARRKRHFQIHGDLEVNGVVLESRVEHILLARHGS